jgi:hypothetical protein
LRKDGFCRYPHQALQKPGAALFSEPQRTQTSFSTFLQPNCTVSHTGGEVDFHAWHSTNSSSKRASFLTSPPVPEVRESRILLGLTLRQSADGAATMPIDLASMSPYLFPLLHKDSFRIHSGQIEVKGYEACSAERRFFLNRASRYASLATASPGRIKMVMLFFYCLCHTLSHLSFRSLIIKIPSQAGQRACLRFSSRSSR